MRRWCWSSVVAVVVVVAVLAGAVPAVAEATYSAPVRGRIIDHFRPPATPYGAGNRGIDFATTPGEVVRAAADGEVTFAGRVGASLHVVVLHPDGLRTSYSFLGAVDVRQGDRVLRGDVVGRAGRELHLGVRSGDISLDPEPLLAGAPPQVHLIPATARRPGPLVRERRALLDALAGGWPIGVSASAAGVDWARGGGDAGITLTPNQIESSMATVQLFAVTALELGAVFLGLNQWLGSRDQGTIPTSSPAPVPSG